MSAILLATNDASAAKYICDGWEYPDGSRETKSVKFEIDGSHLLLDGHPYIIAGVSLSRFEDVDEVFLVLDRMKLKGSQPLRPYHLVLQPCREHDGYAYKTKRMFGLCRKHRLFRMSVPTSAFWKRGMSKTECELF